jgi:ATP-dependent protease HslVU (ClpYQ) peptidase subunit
MTVIAALKHGKKIYLGTDSRISEGGDTFKDLQTPKILELNDSDIMVAYSGDLRIVQLAERLLSEAENAHLLLVSSKQEVYHISDKIMEMLKEYGYYTGTPIMEGAFIIVSRFSEEIFSIDPDFSVHSYSTFFAAGNGGFAAEVALDTAMRLGKTGKFALETALEVVCDRQSSCGGEIHIKAMTLE